MSSGNLSDLIGGPDGFSDFFDSLQGFSLPSSKSTFSQLLKEKCLREVVRIGNIIAFHLSKL